MAFLSSFYPQPVVKGTTAGTFAEGNDPRLSDARTPLSHTHGNISNTGTIGSTAGLPVVTTTSGAISTLALGTANQVLRVNSGATGVEFGAGFDAASPPAIGSTTPSTGAFTTLSAAPTSGSALTLTGGTVTASAPLIDATQTWNNAAVTFTGLAATITNTASATSSLVARFTVGSTNVFEVDGRGFTKVRATTSTATFVPIFEVLRSATSLVRLRDDGDVSATSFGVGLAGNSVMSSSGIGVQSTASIGFGDGAFAGSRDAEWRRDAADTIAQRRLANPQTFRLYNTTDAGLTNFERGFMRWSSNVFQIGTEKGGTGAARGLEFQTDATARFTISSTGVIGLGSSSSSSGLGAVGLFVNTGAFQISMGSYLSSVQAYNQRVEIRGDNAAGSAAVLLLSCGKDLVRFGGTDANFPALKRSSTTLQVRLADDSAFAPLQASQFNGPSDANLTIAARGTTALTFDGNEMYMARQLNGQGNNLYNFATIGFGNASSIGDAVFARDAADTIAQRRGLNAQTYRIYNTVSGTNNVNFERANFRWVANEFIIDAEAGGTGTSLRGIKIGSATSSLLGFYGATPAAQPAAVADATDAASTQARLNDLLARLRTIGIIAT